MAATKPESANARKSTLGPRIFTFLFGLPFFGLGIVFLWIGGLQPIVKVVQSRSWESVPCTILESRVDSHYDSDGTTYSIEVSFRYEWNGQTYTGDRYNLMRMNSSGRKGKKEVVRRYPVGLQTACYVNPRRPSEAVIVRKAGWLPVFVIPFSSIFVVVGGAFLFSTFTREPLLGNTRKGRGFSHLKPRKRPDRSRAKSPLQFHSRYDFPEEDSNPVVLKPEVGRLAQTIGVLFVALFWNGIVSIFLYQVFKSFGEGNPQWFLAVFLIPFVLVGIGALFVVFYSFLALFNPRVEITLTPGTPRMGEPFFLEWRIEGNTRRLKHLSILLEAEEVATYRRGTDSVTVRNIFEQVELASQDISTVTDFSGSTDLAIPMESTHSFKSANNQILWTIKVHGRIRRWPDINAIFPVQVLPAHPVRS